MTDVRVTVTNLQDQGGVFTTPFYTGFHNGDFDLFDVGSEASTGLESIAEDGVFSDAAAERLAVDPNSQGAVVTGAGGPIATGEVTSRTFSLTDTQTHLVLAAMLLPSNDAFVGTDESLVLFDARGNFNGAQTVTFEGSDVYDAGTEENTELDAAFINQTAPNTGVDEGGVIRLHEGFNGSLGNPDGVLGNPEGEPGEQIILGGTNAFGAEIDPIAADFTQPGAQIAEVHINTVVEREGTDGRDIIFGGSDDDIVTAGDGSDVVRGGAGFDDIFGGGGRDVLFGNAGSDLIDGGEDGDWISGGQGNDRLYGGEGNDRIFGGNGDDLINGGAGNDALFGGRGDDTFVFTDGDGLDRIFGFDVGGDDQIALNLEGISSFEDVLDNASDRAGGSILNFGDGDAIILIGRRVSTLEEEDFLFA